MLSQVVASLLASDSVWRHNFVGCPWSALLIQIKKKERACISQGVIYIRLISVTPKIDLQQSIPWKTISKHNLIALNVVITWTYTHIMEMLYQLMILN